MKVELNIDEAGALEIHANVRLQSDTDVREFCAPGKEYLDSDEEYAQQTVPRPIPDWVKALWEIHGVTEIIVTQYYVVLRRAKLFEWASIVHGALETLVAHWSPDEPLFIKIGDDEDGELLEAATMFQNSSPVPEEFRTEIEVEEVEPVLEEPMRLVSAMDSALSSKPSEGEGVKKSEVSSSEKK